MKRINYLKDHNLGEPLPNSGKFNILKYIISFIIIMLIYLYFYYY